MNLPQLYDIFNEKWNKFQTCWIIGDTHFADADMQQYFEAPAPEVIVKAINSKVGKNDMLIILGDVGDVEYVKQLRGYKVLVMGNHDGTASKFKKKVAIGGYDEDLCTKEKAIELMKEKYPNCSYQANLRYDVIHAPFEYWRVTADNCLFDEVYDGPLAIGKKLILSHEPVNVPWAFNIHGHTHDANYKNDDHHLCLCAEKCAYTPLNLNAWLKKSGALSNIKSIHRAAIDRANANKNLL